MQMTAHAPTTAFYKKNSWLPKNRNYFNSREFYLFMGGFESLIFFISAYITDYLSKISQQITTENLLFTVVMMASFAALGLYSHQQQLNARAILVRIFLGFIGGGLVLGSVFYISSVLAAPQGFWGLMPLMLAFVSVSSVRIFLQRYRNHCQHQAQTLILGGGKRAMSVLREAQKNRSLADEIMGFLPIACEGCTIPSNKQVGVDPLLADYALQHGVKQIVVAVDHSENLPVQNLLDCRSKGIKVIELSSFFEDYAAKIDIDSLQTTDVIFNIQRKDWLQHQLCRLFDLSIVLTLFALTAPLLLLTAIAIFIENGFKGPVFYSQVRVGLNNQPFTIWKFRSMSVNAEKKGEVKWAQQNDSRVTVIGKIIRRYRIDELPQLFNIIKGDMSIVGPRPERPEFVSQLSEKIPYYQERHQVKVGLTGWAQINYPYGASDEDAKEKLKYDLYYIKHHSLWLDFLTLLQTVEVILLGKGVR